MKAYKVFRWGFRREKLTPFCHLVREIPRNV